MILGDDGINLSLATRFNLTTTVMSLVNTPSVSDISPTSDPLVAGADNITGGVGNAVIIGDHGAITQVAGRTAQLCTAVSTYRGS